MLIERYDCGPVQALGRLYVLENSYRTIFSCDTLELPWKNNQVKISHIPAGIYSVVKRTSSKFKLHFHLTDTKGRAYILSHAGNTYRDIEGCILVGSDLKDIDNDGHLDVINSKKTLEKLLDLMPDKFTLTIKER